MAAPLLLAAAVIWEQIKNENIMYAVQTQLYSVCVVAERVSDTAVVFYIMLQNIFRSLSYSEAARVASR